MRPINLTGKTFNRWKVIERSVNTPSGQSQWLCECTCGNRKILKSIVIRTDISKSCGCLKKELPNANTRHGHATNRISPTYHSWAGMKARCTNTKHRSYIRYGAKGIKIDDSWFNFKNFLIDMGEKPTGKSLDRIDNSGNYCKENCRWATATEQGRNKSNNVYFTANGKTHTISEWAEIEGICFSSMVDRIKHNYYSRH